MKRNKSEQSQSSGNQKKVAIVGLPNSGKSQVFNNITGEYTIVANYAFSTIKPKKAICKIGSQDYEIIDTPGLHCLQIHSEEELAVRELIFTEKPDVIVQCIDANRLNQSLILTADLLELEIPLVVSLNAIDETAKKGVWIDSNKLSELLGIPVIESVAVKNIGTDKLKAAIQTAQNGKKPIHYGEIVEDGISTLEPTLPDEFDFKRKASILMLLGDPYLSSTLENLLGENAGSNLAETANQIKKGYKGNIARNIQDKRNNWLDNLLAQSVKKQKIQMNQFSETFAHLSRHPIFGLPILAMAVVIVFFLVVDVANVFAGWLDETIWAPVANQIEIHIANQFWKDFLIGDYGILSLGLVNAFLTVLPILSVFFLFYNFLEDIGYIPNLSVLVKRIFEKIGLSGAAIMPLVLGFGCKTMATMTTKSLSSKKERYIAIYLIAFAIPCAPQMALNMSILGRMGVTAFVIAFSVLILVEVIAGMVLNKAIKDEEKSDFIQALPPIRLPNPMVVLKKTYYKIYWFILEAVPVFVWAAIVLFAIDGLGILDAIKIFLEPVMGGFLGLPTQMVDALILTMARHEAAAGMIIKLIERGELNYVQSIVSVTITTMFVPCFANIMAMIREQGAKKALTMVLFINASAFILAAILNWVLTKGFNL